MECNFPFPQQLWLGEGATILRYTYSALPVLLYYIHQFFYTNIFHAALGAEYDHQEQKSKRLYRRQFDVCVTMHH